MDNWDCEKSEWWYTCCDDENYDLKIIKSPSMKRDTKKGLRECKICEIDPQNFIELSYDIYKNSRLSYGEKKSKILSKSMYEQIVLKRKKYYGYKIWGAFVGNNLAAYSTPITLDNATLLSETRSDRKFYKQNPNNALFYEMTKYYLNKEKVLYVSNGHRTILHPTSINDFLLRLGFRKVYCKLNVELSTKAKVISYLRTNGLNNLTNLLLNVLPVKKKNFKLFLNL